MKISSSHFWNIHIFSKYPTKIGNFNKIWKKRCYQISQLKIGSMIQNKKNRFLNSIKNMIIYQKIIKIHKRFNFPIVQSDTFRNDVIPIQYESQHQSEVFQLSDQIIAWQRPFLSIFLYQAPFPLNPRIWQFTSFLRNPSENLIPGSDSILSIF